MEKPKLDLRKLSEKRVNKVTGKTETVLVHDVIMLFGNGTQLFYSKTHNCYYAKDKGSALEGDALLKALANVRWEFSKVEKDKDLFPPTPENIDFKRKELFSELKSADPQELAGIYARCIPTGIVPAGKYKQAEDSFLNSEAELFRSLLPRG